MGLSGALPGFGRVITNASRVSLGMLTVDVNWLYVHRWGDKKGSKLFVVFIG